MKNSIIINKLFISEILYKVIGKNIKVNNIMFDFIVENLLINKWCMWFRSPIKGFVFFNSLSIETLNRSKPGNIKIIKISSAYGILPPILLYWNSKKKLYTLQRA